jgi:tRNA(Ile)-lysidine synthase
VPEAAPIAPLSDADMAALMAPLGPFERRPHLAVGVSGGADSMALTLLAAAWARARGGELSGLTVDHGLRAGSRAEAEQTGRWLADHDVDHAILRWTGAKPVTGVQAAAREARHALLETWCRERGVLHLLLAHHRDDQAETVVLREQRGSGPDGLAAIAAVREVPGLRLLRPLLPVPKERLVATLAARRQPWLDDPTNRTTRFARGRLRRSARLDRERAIAVAVRAGHERSASDRRLADWLVRHATIDPTGFALLDREAIAGAPTPVAERALQRVLMAIGDGGHPPRRERLLRVLAWIGAGATSAGRTLAGCRILPRGARLLVCREPSRAEPARPLAPHAWQRWDRFLLRVRGPWADLRLGAFGAEGWRQRQTLRAGSDARTLPAAVRASLPALWRDGRLLAAPHLDLYGDLHDGPTADVVDVRFCPNRALAGAPFALPPVDGGPMAGSAAASSLLHWVERLC